jgi:hypothetical protein
MHSAPLLVSVCPGKLSAGQVEGWETHPRTKVKGGMFKISVRMRQVYETASELTEAREEAEVLRIRLEAAEQEVEAARHAAAAAQAAAVIANTDSPCPSPQRMSLLPPSIAVRHFAPLLPCPLSC